MYIKYEVYNIPYSPGDDGKFIAETKTLEEAQELCKESKDYFIKGVMPNGRRVIFI